LEPNTKAVFEDKSLQQFNCFSYFDLKKSATLYLLKKSLNLKSIFRGNRNLFFQALCEN
jgi:hypothetical protein